MITDFYLKKIEQCEDLQTLFRLEDALMSFIDKVYLNSEMSAEEYTEITASADQVIDERTAILNKGE